MKAQGPTSIKLNPQHQIIQEYLKHKSWKKAGIHPQEGKNAVLAVLEHYMDHYADQEEEPTKEVSEPIAEI